ncbi:MAG: FAD:protein FMN transferase [Ilumatobacter sp.]|jgi:FAD:protein FMN transferase|uniref:FAD:protein FMN transferase n=1 Tax=Ilumatobacter sp. TaxID=1967498 RepID=UPI001D5D6AE2|nr:FAD:protein FMN transferase [Ilumatobacter sp.]MBT5276050.1 FAD:protein FMN transferase [Ilumatobacter sp.]MBT5867173.1 FAD:protein FMN transferase [Ilumatobacter sp.]MDG0975494.1 FAD:protein FMN transferase [Ilumatobacter sp.]
MQVVDRRFRVMASATQLLLVNPGPRAAEWAESRLRELEARWSRFIETSDITAVNRNPDVWTSVSNDTIDLIQTMQSASSVTGGAYDPTFLHRLLSAGYTLSIDDPDRFTIAVDSPCLTHSVHDVRVDVSMSNVMVPTGLSLDPGGIGKGLAADLVVSALLASGTQGALVSIGGDIAAAGKAPTAEGWHVHVEDPYRPAAPVTTIGVSAGGIATSSTRSRRWIHEGCEQHHIIDPTTGEPSATDLATVTVVANAGWLAEAHATAALLAGSGGAVAYLNSHGLAGVVIDAIGAVSGTPGIADSVQTIETGATA